MLVEKTVLFANLGLEEKYRKKKYFLNLDQFFTFRFDLYFQALWRNEVRKAPNTEFFPEASSYLISSNKNS